MPRGHRRTDAAPADAVQTFTRKTVDGDVFAQAFVGRTIDGVMVGRVFGTKTVNGDLAIGEAVLFSGKTLEPIAFGGKFTGEPGTFGAKLTSTEVIPFGRKITIGEPAGIRAQGGDEYLRNFASAAVVLPAPRHDRRRMGAAGFNHPAAFPF